MADAVRGRTFVTHPPPTCVSAGQPCNASRVRAYIKLSGVSVTSHAMKIGYPRVSTIPPIKVKVTEHQLVRRRCACGVHTTGVAPEGVDAPVQYQKTSTLIPATTRQPRPTTPPSAKSRYACRDGPRGWPGRSAVSTPRTGNPHNVLGEMRTGIGPGLRCHARIASLDPQ
jgi:hypothetical protein